MIDKILALVPYATWLFAALAIVFAIAVTREFLGLRRAAIAERAQLAKSKASQAAASQLVLAAHDVANKIYTATIALNSATATGRHLRFSYGEAEAVESSTTVFQRLVQSETLTRALSSTIYLDHRLQLGSASSLAKMIQQCAIANEELGLLILASKSAVDPKWRANAGNFLRNGTVLKDGLPWIETGTSVQPATARVG